MALHSVDLMAEMVKLRVMNDLPPNFLPAIHRVVEQALDQAASVTLPRFRQKLEVDSKCANGFDPVTVADREAEQILRDRLCAALPYAQFLGEENSVHPRELDPADSLEFDPAMQSALTWVVDPIDGTRAFITGLPLWGTLVALNDGRQVLYGALDQPWLEERFVGVGGQARRYCRGRCDVLRTRPARALGDCIVQTTSPDMFAEPQARARFKRVRQQVAMTRYGGDCYAYALLAMGGVDAVIESSLQPYDIQALMPIVEGAGGVITNWAGEPCLDGGSVVAAANEQVHESLLEELHR